ncbi:MAG: glycosyltransferase [Bacteroidota bacterium]
MAAITLVGPSWPYRGGIAHFQTSMQRTLTSRGHDVNAITFQRQYPEVLFPGTTQFDPGPAPEDLPLAHRLVDSLNPLSWRRAASAGSASDVAVLSYWMPFLAPATGVIARGLRQRGVTVLGLVHNAIPHERRPGDRALTRYALRACDGLVVLSEDVERDVESLGLDAPRRRVEHPVYDTFGDPVDRSDARRMLQLAEAPTFLFFGFIRRYKGLHVLLDAWPSVRQRVPAAQLVIAGEFYADEDALRAQIDALDGVRLDADYIPDARVPLYVSAADAVVQPYITATQSGVAQVAFHFGRPVITTDVGGLAEVVPDGEAGLVVPPDDAAALANALVRFVTKDLGPTLSAGAVRQRDRFSWDRLAEAIEDLGGIEPPAGI